MVLDFVASEIVSTQFIGDLLNNFQNEFSYFYNGRRRKKSKIWRGILINQFNYKLSWKKRPTVFLHIEIWITKLHSRFWDKKFDLSFLLINSSSAEGILYSEMTKPPLHECNGAFSFVYEISWEQAFIRYLLRYLPPPVVYSSWLSNAFDLDLSRLYRYIYFSRSAPNISV